MAIKILSKEEFVAKMIHDQKVNHEVMDSPYETAEAVEAALMAWREKLISRVGLKVADVTFGVHDRRTDADGWCRKKSPMARKAKITIGKWLLNKPRRLVDDVLVHELCHAVIGCTGHKEKWQKTCKRVMKTFPSLHLAQFIGDELVNLEVDEVDVPYVVVCPHCGKRWFYYRAGKVVKALLAGDTSHHCWDCGTVMELDYNHSALAQK